ncbi:MAG: hypothetical protein ABIB79_04720 [archaeon]
MKGVVNYLTEDNFKELDSLKCTAWIRHPLQQSSTPYEGHFSAPLNGEPPAVLTSDGQRVRLEKDLTHIRYLPIEALGNSPEERWELGVEY